MYEWIPPRNNTKATRLTMLLCVGAGLLLATAVSFGNIPFRWVFQLAGLVLLTVAIFLTTRYVMKSFLYRIVSDDRGGYDLTVTELTSGGKRKITVCRVGLDGIYKTVFLNANDPASAERWRAIKKERRKIFDYAVDLKPERFIVVYLRESGEDLTLRLSYDGTLFDLLTSYGAREDL